MQDKRISTRQFTMLVIMYTIGYGILILPHFLTLTARQQAWQIVVIGFPVIAYVAYLYFRLFRKHPRLDLFELMDHILGKWISRVFIIILLWMILFVSLTSLLSLIEGFITTEIMTETPSWTFALMFMFIIVVGIKLGVQTISKANEMLFYIFNVFFFTLILTVLPKVRSDPLAIKFIPMFEVGWQPMLVTFLNYFSAVGAPLIILLAFFPKEIEKPETATRSFVLGTSIGGVYLLIILLCCIGVLGYDLTSTAIYPSYNLAQRINIADFFTRIEVLMAASWFITIYIKLIFYYKFSVRGLSHLLNIQNQQLLAVPLAITPLILSFYIYPDISSLFKFEITIWTYASIAFLFGIPLLLLTVGKLRRMI
ncbi:GerAB/ArcD/ProY family transporter [Paenibacillus guangzhouensis]|uniref:GerAB/ArcD/ProY family transporter n=1 Tax=Paenibacillus guangzhouensis TaxID=1473112 RepID=UPI001266DD63|nr:endospore germination permease [Paenibacillus guangzhouensis]